MRLIVTALALSLSTAALADGAATYAAKCKACHGASGEGAKLAPKPIAGLPAAEVKKAIDEGKGKMKPVKIDNSDEVASFVAGLKK